MKNLKTIDGATLMTQPFVPLPFVIDGLLSQGLHILAGSPKVGKSWLALWLSVQVPAQNVFPPAAHPAAGASGAARCCRAPADG